MKEPIIFKFIAPQIACFLSAPLNFKNNDEKKKGVISRIKQRDIRQIARELHLQPSTVQYWFKSNNFPLWVLDKYEPRTNDHVTLHIR